MANVLRVCTQQAKHVDVGKGGLCRTTGCGKLQGLTSVPESLQTPGLSFYRVLVTEASVPRGAAERCGLRVAHKDWLGHLLVKHQAGILLRQILLVCALVFWSF